MSPNREVAYEAGIRVATAMPYTGMFAEAAGFFLTPALGLPSLQTCECFGVPHCPEALLPTETMHVQVCGSAKENWGVTVPS